MQEYTLLDLGFRWSTVFVAKLLLLMACSKINWACPINLSSIMDNKSDILQTDATKFIFRKYHRNVEIKFGIRVSILFLVPIMIFGLTEDNFIDRNDFYIGKFINQILFYSFDKADHLDVFVLFLFWCAHNMSRVNMVFYYISTNICIRGYGQNYFRCLFRHFNLLLLFRNRNSNSKNKARKWNRIAV